MREGVRELLCVDFGVFFSVSCSQPTHGQKLVGKRRCFSELLGHHGSQLWHSFSSLSNCTEKLNTVHPKDIPLSSVLMMVVESTVDGSGEICKEKAVKMIGCNLHYFHRHEVMQQALVPCGWRRS